MAEEKTKLKKYWSEQSIALALQGRWSDAVTANQNILALFPSDSEAYNRLGKAYTELGKYAEAKDSYAHALQIDPGNGIAEKNLARLTRLASAQPSLVPTPVPLGQDYLSPQLFIEEMGKTASTTLINPAALNVLAKQSAGDPVRLRIENRTLVVDNIRGERLGEVENRLGQRVIGFMKAGNRYAAAISGLDTFVKIMIREIYQDPSQIGRVSFPVKGGDTFRSYIKDSVLKYDLDDDDDDSADDQDQVADGDGAGDDNADDNDSFDDDISGNTSDDK
jgi:tetratricopeptide (TPR) repeat protein